MPSFTVKGSTDQVFQRLARKFNSLSSDHQIRVPIVETSQVLEEAVWYLDNDTDGGSCGTCFTIDGSKFITCDHCLGENLNAYPKSAPNFPVAAVPIARDRANDLAIINLNGLLPAHTPRVSLQLATQREIDALSIGDQVQLAGFPGNQSNDSLTFQGATITRFSVRTFDGS